MPQETNHKQRKITFKKGMYTISFPFMLHGFSPWQEQIKTELGRVQKTYKVRKSARWGFSITENVAEIKCYKH